MSSSAIHHNWTAKDRSNDTMKSFISRIKYTPLTTDQMFFSLTALRPGPKCSCLADMNMMELF